MAEVEDLVAKAADIGYPGLGLTDHGNMGGSARLYREARRHGISPYPGIEAYVVHDVADKAAERYHLTLVALDYGGYKALVRLSSRSHERDRYHRKPLLDYGDLAEAHEAGLLKGVFCGTGCYFGEVSQVLVRHGEDQARAKLQMLAAWFPRLAVEIQHHHTDHGDGWDDTKLAEALYGLAGEVGLPVVVTGDAHYCDSGHREAHTLMKGLVYRSADPGDVGFPGDSYHLASGQWMREHYAGSGVLRRIWNESLDTLGDIVDHHEVEIPVLDHYAFRMPSISADPDAGLAVLVHQCWETMASSVPEAQHDRYRQRLEDELRVIVDTGYAAYFLLTYDVVSWATEHGIRVMARGSANGSLICWVLGITSVDPVRWNLLFEAFLTRDRSTPPDIDLDIDQARRKEVMGYVASRWKTVQLGAWGRLGMDESTGKGSLLRRFQSWMDRRGVPNAYAWGTEAVARSFPRQWRALQVLEEIMPVEKAGVHAAGSVIDPGGLLREVVPTMLIASSDTTVTQWEMEDVELAGYVKIDLLGLRTITSISHTLDAIGETWAWWDGIPLNDKEAMKQVRLARRDSGLFQLEGGAATRGIHELRPRGTSDVVLAMALFRPACIDSGATSTYMSRRHRQMPVTYPHPITEPALRSTLGVPLYSEQVLQICWALGLDTETTQRIIKAMKVKRGRHGVSEASTRAFAEARIVFADAAKTAGLTDSAVEELWNLLEGFQRYGFKASHATAYGLLAYKTAYLKAHYPKEFMLGLLQAVSLSQPDKVAPYVSEARRMGLIIWPPHVNTSGVSWSLQTEAIQRGLIDIKGVGQRAAQAIVDAAPYHDLADLIDRTPGRLVTGGKDHHRTGQFKGVLRALEDAGALNGLA